MFGLSKKWGMDDIPDLSGKVVIVTGANSGLGYWSVWGMARRGAKVIMACRAMEKGGAAKKQILQDVPTADLVVMPLDLADLQSVRAFVGAILANYTRLDILMNNAGLMAIPEQETVDGFEMQFGTNHLGHFALTVQLFGLLTGTLGSRVVTVSSFYHRRGKMNFDDLMHRRNYDRWEVYAQSKLANLLFTAELQRKFVAQGSKSLSVGAHPGWAATNLQTKGSLMRADEKGVKQAELLNRIFAQSAERGSLPQLYAATAEDVRGGEYFGPRGLMEMAGAPKRVWIAPQARDEVVAMRLWAESVALTGVDVEMKEG